MTPPRHVEDAAPYKDGPKPPHTRAPSGQHPLTLPPPRRGRACPARTLSHNHSLTFHIVGRGLDPSACPFPASTRSPLHHSVGAGHARPATSPPPAVNLPPLTPIICARQPPSPQYTPCPNFTLKLCRKNQKNLQKPVDKGHTTCYNNQAVSRAQPAAAAAGAFTYSLYAVF